MRTVLAIAILAALPLALPMAAGDTCLPACRILSHTLGYVSPVVEVGSGSTVTWETLDIVHTSTERATFCFHVDFNVGQPATAYFEVIDGMLYAQSDSGELEACPGIAALPGGVFDVEYFCLLHPNMRAHLIIR